MACKGIKTLKKPKGISYKELEKELMLRKSFRESTPRTREEKLKRAIARRRK